jgi:RNA polymerase sigma factor (sigma-70 family)
MPPLDLENLLVEAAWLARVARGIAADAAEADDAVQETWVAALRSPPAGDRPARPWLRTVLGNAIRMRRRSGRRRASPEETFEALRESPPTPEELHERAELERRLATAVAELDEPYRSTVMLRYREGLTAEQIAEVQGIPAGTVRWRLKTALDRLRREHGDATEPRAWRALVAPAAATPAGGASLVGGILMASTKKKLALAALALLLVGGAVAAIAWTRRPDGARVSGPPDVPDRPSGASGVRPDRLGPDMAGQLAALLGQPDRPARRIAGRVTRDGAPAAGATVRLGLAGLPVLVDEVTTGADGRFDLGERSAAAYEVVASAGPDVAAAGARVDLRRDDATPPSDRLELALSGCAGTLSGTVFDGSGGTITGARVSLGEGAWPATETDADGRYRLCGAWGPATARFRADGYNGVDVDLHELDGPMVQDVVLIPEATLAGIVEDPDGAPVAGAWVAIIPDDFGAERGAAVYALSGPDGRFEVSAASAGRNLVTAVAPGWITPRPIEAVAVAGEVGELRVRVAPAGRIDGVVVDPRGQPVGGVGVGIRIGNKGQGDVQAVTGADGRFRIAEVPPGEISLHVERHTVTAPRGVVIDGAEEVRLEVAALATVRGRVVRGGAPVAGALVECPEQPRTDAGGRFTCAGLPPGRVHLAARTAQALGEAEVEVAAGEVADVEIALGAAAWICGEVVDQDGAPVARAAVRFTHEAGADLGETDTLDDGSFCVGRLRGGAAYLPTVRLGATIVEPPAPFAPVSLEDGDQRVDDVRLAITYRRLAIAGRVTDSDGAPVADARVVAEPAGGGGWRFGPYHRSPLALTDVDGRFRIDGLPGGEHALLARGRDGSMTLAPSVAAGTLDVELTLDPAGRIEGVLEGFAAPPLVVAIISSYGHPPLDAQVDGERFRITAVPPGRYVLTAVSGPQAAAAVVEVAPGATATVTMRSPGSGVVTGRLVDHATGAPIAGHRCDVSPRAGDAVGVQYFGPDSEAITDADGRFRIDPAPAGEGFVHCRGGGTSGGLRALTVGVGETVDVELPAVAHRDGVPFHDLGARLGVIDHRIIELLPGGAAARAGLAVGDRIVAVDGKPVDALAFRGIVQLIAQRPAGTAATVEVERGGATRSVSIAF